MRFLKIIYFKFVFYVFYMLLCRINNLKIKVMKGLFVNKEECIKNLRNQCYIFYTSHNGILYFYCKEKQEIAEIIVYSDGSASALIGHYKF